MRVPGRFEQENVIVAIDQKRNEVTLEIASREELSTFKRDLQESFASGMLEAFGSSPDEPIPSDADIEESFDAPGAVTYHVLLDGIRVGGAVVSIDEKTQYNALELFFVSPRFHGQGIGLKAWLAIEARHPETRVWETHTPYFEKRNIHFYVNKCGFKIVEYYNEYHPAPHGGLPENVPGGEEMFRFEKVLS